MHFPSNNLRQFPILISKCNFSTLARKKPRKKLSNPRSSLSIKQEKIQNIYEIIPFDLGYSEDPFIAINVRFTLSMG